MTGMDLSGWPESGPYRTLFRVERSVWVDMMRVWPGLGSCARRQDELPLFVRGWGLRVEPWMEGTLRAWLRRADGGWIALVFVPAAAANGSARLTLQLWVDPTALTADRPW